jgi:hypothetical protein
LARPETAISGIRRKAMHAIFPRCAAAFIFVSGIAAIAAQSGSPDAVFANIPLDRWIDDGEQAHFHWTARVLPLELSNHQRLQAKIELLVDGNDLVRRRGPGYLVMLVQFRDSENRVYQTHESLDLKLVKEDTGKSNVSYIPAVFVTPGDYQISLAILDTATGEHNAMRIPLHVNPLKNDPLPDSWRDLPPIEIAKAGDSPDDLFLPNVTGRLHLPLETHRPVQVEVLVNASPLSAGEPSPTEQINNRSLASLIPALKVISHMDVRNGTLNVSLLDLTRQRVIFQEDALRDLDWAKLRPALKQTSSNSIDVHSLENRRQNAQFFLDQVRRRIGANEPNAGPAGPLPILIVLSGPMAFSSGEDLHPIELGGKSGAEVFYIRYHSIPPRQMRDPFLEESRRGRRAPLSQPGRGAAPLAEPVDSLERTLKPLQPHLFDVNTPEQFRRALSSVFNEISRQ